ncbi:MAG: hypothetical protein HY815_01820 [Candidatus Riflebacteria bacterium]|nr:hypothetical protein [Candidatus Riflebacteria bacterium]
MEETNTPRIAPGGSARPVIQAEMEFRGKLDEFRPRLIQWAREVEKPLGEVGDLRTAHAHLRHILSVAGGATILEEVVLYVEYQGARRSLHIPVANRMKGHLREIQKLAGADERLGLALAQTYVGFVTRLAKIAQVQRGSKPIQKPKPAQPQPQQAQPQRPKGAGRPDRRPGRAGPPPGRGTPEAAARPAAEARPETPVSAGEPVQEARPPVETAPTPPETPQAPALEIPQTPPLETPQARPPETPPPAAEPASAPAATPPPPESAAVESGEGKEG